MHSVPNDTASDGDNAVKPTPLVLLAAAIATPSLLSWLDFRDAGPDPAFPRVGPILSAVSSATAAYPLAALNPERTKEVDAFLEHRGVRLGDVFTPVDRLT